MKRVKNLLFAMALVLPFAFVGCDDDKGDEPQPGPQPEEEAAITTNAITELPTYRSVKLSGSVVLPGKYADAEYGIVYGTSDDLKKSGTRVAKSKEKKTAFTVELEDLLFLTKYYYAAYVEKGGELYLGVVKEFTTPKMPHDVNLNLPSKTNWATKNVGAESADQMGYLFQWGDVKGYKNTPSDRKLFDWGNYKYSTGIGTGTLTSLKKYNENDLISLLEEVDDPASQTISEFWHAPSVNQCNELLNPLLTKLDMITVNGTKGLRVTSLDNGEYVFFPFTGYRVDDKYKNDKVGYYWTRNLNTYHRDCAYEFRFMDVADAGTFGQNSLRCYGYAVRPVIQY